MGMYVVNEISPYDTDYWNGQLLIWEAPEPGETYAIGVDPANGVGMDRSVCEVIKVGTINHPDIQVAEFACDWLSPVDFASVVATIGRFYRDSEGTEAFATVEVNAPCGDTMVSDLRMRLDYGNLFIWKQYDRINNLFTNKYGWWTNKTTRPKLIARGVHACMNGDLIINSPFLLDEMSDFERDGTLAAAKARSGTHDDRVMAILIGYWGAHDEEWLNGEDIAEERRMRERAKELQIDLTVKQEVSDNKARRTDWWSQPISYKDMMRQAEAKFFDELD